MGGQIEASDQTVIGTPSQAAPRSPVEILREFVAEQRKDDYPVGHQTDHTGLLFVPEAPEPTGAAPDFSTRF